MKAVAKYRELLDHLERILYAQGSV